MRALKKLILLGKKLYQKQSISCSVKLEFHTLVFYPIDISLLFLPVSLLTILNLNPAASNCSSAGFGVRQ